ncbi:MAG: glucose-6-phosphate dehydrogenase assembly protein OpcA [Thermaerobacter sp.]|nr:glucose-6-phosphate dehydrogenase assembly protein OpcA [Thermaerobacter sp.]
MDNRTIEWRAQVSGPDLLRTLPAIIRNELAGHDPIIATVLTLGLYVAGIPPEDWTQLAARMAGAHPARILIINPDRKADGPGIAVHYTASVRGGEPPVLFSECLDLHLEGSLATYWIDMVQPLIHSDLPSYLWWRGEPPHEPFRWDLLRTGFTHLIIDSHGQWESWRPSLAAAHREGMAIDDLEWLRLAAWRRLWADAADHPDASHCLFHAERITFEGPSETMFLMMSAWLASRLGWGWIRSEPRVITLANPDGLAAINWHPAPSSRWIFDTARFRLTMSSLAERISATLENAQGAAVARWTGEQPAGEPLALVLRLLNLGHDALYDESLKSLLGDDEE